MVRPTAQLTLPKSEGAQRFVVGWICNGDVTNQMAASLLDFAIVDGDRAVKEGRAPRLVGKISILSSPRIVAARTDMIEAFLLSTDADWLLTIDSDMSFDVEDLDRLLRCADPKRRPIVGGLCFGGGRNTPGQPLLIFPTLYRIWTAEDGKLDSETIKDYPKDKLFEVSATGAAFMLIHRSVLVAMRETFGKDDNPYPYYSELVVRGKPMGEDVAFCIRAAALGFKTFVHTGVKINHEKRYHLTEALYDETRARHS